ncbi:hypothetical protein AVEN_161223-1 [Araneus ventricosus]|uniref:Uncharacterized protein n=1 Tax=Araneus ventricosus TaxID=182803 RepID=A0A4Y2DAW8_ARAVE|nr:hypothetical protein AVEN_161223-1 [Araneus ventricosus]
MIETLKTTLEGTGTFVHKKMTGDEYFRPTPVIITSNNYIWANSPGSREAILARCLHFYDDLKAFPLLKNCTKAQNPKWITIRADSYLREEEKFAFSFQEYVPDLERNASTMTNEKQTTKQLKHGTYGRFSNHAKK